MSIMNNRIEIEELNCPVCQEQYDDDEKNPRILLCGHTYCSGCLRTLLRDEDPLCPECRFSINETSVESLPVCYIVKKIVDSVKAINVRIVNGTNTRGIKENEVTFRDGDLPSMGTCTNHNAPKHFWCAVCKIWICGTCTFLNHQKSLCKAVLINDQTAVNILIESEIKQIYSQKEILLQVGEFLEECNKLNYSHFRNHQNGGNEDCYISMLQYLNSEIIDNNESMEIIEDALTAIADISAPKTLKSWQEVVNYIKNLWSCQEYPKSIEDILKDFWKNAVVEGKILSWTTKLKKKFVFLKYVNGEKRGTFGRLLGDFYIVRSLQQYDHNIHHKNSTPICFSSIHESGYTFMELSENDECIGTIIFKLSAGCRSNHFRALCTGELGPSYKGTRFFNDGGNFNCFLAGGDYENNNGTGGKGLYPFNEDFLMEMREGLVCGNHSNAISLLGQFKIFYECRGNYQTYARGVMAEVVQGLDLVQDIARSGTFINVIISECGMAFHISP